MPVKAAPIKPGRAVLVAPRSKTNQFSRIKNVVAADGIRAAHLRKRGLRYVTAYAALRQVIDLSVFFKWGADRKAQWRASRKPPESAKGCRDHLQLDLQDSR
jgi:hypothetical protein